MRSLAPFGYICSIKSPQIAKYNIYVNTRYELATIVIDGIYIIYFKNTIYIYINAFELQDYRFNKVCDL